MHCLSLHENCCNAATASTTTITAYVSLLLTAIGGTVLNGSTVCIVSFFLQHQTETVIIQSSRCD